ncbi:hypothetical protein MHU86_2009 [Fragilaria crotonensis]|nr:hypothetical protein MHU86_2009 [Fragilaria crotonensis]
MKEVKAKWEGKADKSPGQRPVEELPVEGSAMDLHRQAGLQMADENLTSGRMPARDRRLLPQQRNRIAVPTARRLGWKGNTYHAGVLGRLHAIGGRIARREGVDARGSSAQSRRQHVGGWVACKVELQRQLSTTPYHCECLCELLPDAQDQPLHPMVPGKREQDGGHAFSGLNARQRHHLARQETCWLTFCSSALQGQPSCCRLEAGCNCCPKHSSCHLKPGQAQQQLALLREIPQTNRSRS